MAVYSHNTKNISQALNCLVSDFQRGWTHVALFNFNFECVHSAVLRTKSLEPVHRPLDQAVYPPEPLQSLGSCWEGSTPWMWGSGKRCEAGEVLPIPMWISPACSAVYSCNEYGSVTLMDLKVNLELLHANVGRSCFQKVCKEKNAAGSLNPLDC